MAAGGGSGWTSHINRGEVFKVDEAGQIAATYPLGIGSGWMAFADGVLWVGNLDEGTVTGIDGVTGATTHTYRFDHPVGPIAAGDGVLLVSLFPGPTVSDRLDSLEGRVAKFFSHAGELGGDEPALNVDQARTRSNSPPVRSCSTTRTSRRPRACGWHRDRRRHADNLA